MKTGTSQLRARKGFNFITSRPRRFFAHASSAFRAGPLWIFWTWDLGLSATIPLFGDSTWVDTFATINRKRRDSRENENGNEATWDSQNQSRRRFVLAASRHLGAPTCPVEVRQRRKFREGGSPPVTIPTFFDPIRPNPTESGLKNFKNSRITRPWTSCRAEVARGRMDFGLSSVFIRAHPWLRSR